MGSCSLKSLQAKICFAFIFISISTLFLHAAITLIEIKHPKKDPHYPHHVNYLCFPKEDENSMGEFMTVLRVLDVILVSCALVVCSIIGCSPSWYKLHWVLSTIALLRFGIIIGDLLNVSNMSGDTQLDIILSITDGSCQIADHQMSAFHATLAIFVLRCIKWFLTIVLAGFSYGNSMLFFFFGIEEDTMEVDPEDRPEEHELEEMMERRHSESEAEASEDDVDL